MRISSQKVFDKVEVAKHTSQPQLFNKNHRLFFFSFARLTTGERCGIVSPRLIPSPRSAIG